MNRPLCLAISLALTVITGCSTSEPARQNAQGASPPEPVATTEQDEAKRDGELGAVAMNTPDPAAAPSGASPPARRPMQARRDAPKERIELAEVTFIEPPPPPPASPTVTGGIAYARVIAQPQTAADPVNRENYADVESNPIRRVAEQPVSTFSIDVDSGSYANVRRMLVGGSLPPSDAVRAEEMINYFDYGYAPPASRATPFSVTTELAPAPWNSDRHLLLVGIKGFEVPAASIPAANLVFLIDTSGSMESADKIELLKQAFAQMVPTLRPQDRISIVTYAGSAGLVLPPTAGSERDTILAALGQLAAGGSTNGGAGIELAYATAQQSFIPNGVNRVILATDGDFNVGTVDIDALKTLVAAKRGTGIALTTLGFGTGNYNDATAEQLADIGNGNHAYIDTLAEGRKVLVDELSSTMLTIAKDVKIQMEFNPAVVAEYRLIGYENRVLQREDFNNDRVDAGEIGAGHDVTALYELALVGYGAESVDPLRYGAGRTPEPAADHGGSSAGAGRKPEPAAPKSVAGASGELGYLRLRYKQPEAETSRLIEQPIALSAMRPAASERLQFAAAVAAFAEALRGGKHLGEWTLDDVAQLAQRGRGQDADGYRGEFVALVEQARALQPGGAPVAIAD